MSRKRNKSKPSKSQRSLQRVSKSKQPEKSSIADALQNVHGLDPTARAIALLTLNATAQLARISANAARLSDREDTRNELLGRSSGPFVVPEDLPIS